MQNVNLDKHAFMPIWKLVAFLQTNCDLGEKETSKNVSPTIALEIPKSKYNQTGGRRLWLKTWRLKKYFIKILEDGESTPVGDWQNYYGYLWNWCIWHQNYNYVLHRSGNNLKICMERQETLNG